MARDPWAQPKEGGGPLPILFIMLLIFGLLGGAVVGAWFWLKPVPLPPVTHLESGAFAELVLLPKEGASDMLPKAADVLRKRLEVADIKGRVDISDGGLHVHVADVFRGQVMTLALAGGELWLQAAFSEQGFAGDYAAELQDIEAARSAGEDLRALPWGSAKDAQGVAYLLAQPGVAGFLIEDVHVHDETLELIFNAEGARALQQLTAEHRGGRLAFVLDGEIVNLPTITAPVEGDKLGWSGLSADEIQTMRALLLAGDKLPLELTLEE